MSSTRIVPIVIVGLASIGIAVACGPDFPWQLLDNRADTLNQPVELNFRFEATRLKDAPRDALKVVEQKYKDEDKARDEVLEAEKVEAQSGGWPGSDPDRLLALLTAARNAVNGEISMAKSAGLPQAVRLYIAGAIDFRADDFDSALKFFEEIDQLPADQGRLRIVASAYMQGRVHQRKGEGDLARAAFARTRREAATGAPDPLGLAVASLGEEARVYLLESGLVPSKLNYEPVDDDAKNSLLIARAVELYAEQAARGSEWALLSLREVAERLLGADLLDQAVTVPILRRLTIAYVTTNMQDSSWSNDAVDDTSAGLMSVVAEVQAPTEGADIDRLATLAYQAGRYDVAERLVANTTRPLGLWVRAKLALRRGDRAAAVKDWTAALAATANAAREAQLDPQSTTRLRGEASVIRLTQGQYRETLDLLMPVARTYWGDIAYVAERILSVDELKAFVDGLPAAAAKSTRDDNDDTWSLTDDPVQSLRDLLARRLMRVGREREAMAYFSTGDKSRGTSPDGYRPPAEDAKAYIAAMEAAQPKSFWQDVTRAEAMFKFATLTRQRGMEVMGTEGSPDYAALDGNFSFGVGQEAPVRTYEDQKESDRKAQLALLGPDEAARFAASAPKPNVRFHYRLIASERAAAAAELLPHRSQAYAATLCWAAKYAIEGQDQARAEALYKRYISTGAYQPWAKAFGGTCPDPDFDQARNYWLRRIGLLFERALHRPAAMAALVLAAVVLIGGAFWLRRRRTDQVA